MIIFERVPEPKDFKEKCEQSGEEWIASHPKGQRPDKKKRVQDFWSPFKPMLYEGFRGLCGYCFLYDPTGGTVDHYISCETDESKAYKWDNYRLSMGWLNSSKNREDDKVLDPFDADDEWFEILLPSMQMVMTKTVPDCMKAKVKYTLKRLHLIDDERVIRPRREWYRMYVDGELTLEGLRKKAPLIARAVDKTREDY